MLEDLFSLRDSKALVTGGAVGIGRACATALAMAGADVAILGRNERAGSVTCQKLREFGVAALFVKCDVSQRDQISAAMEQVSRHFGRLDIAINNAGGTEDADALDMSPVQWDKTIDLNLGGVFWCAQGEAQQMIKQGIAGGKIINIASIYAHAAGGNCAYNASKAAIVQLTRSLAVEWGPHNVNVNCISPGWLQTPGNPLSPALRSRMREITPTGSLMRYEDLYGAVIYLASNASNFVTGAELIIDGGHSVNTWLLPVRREIPPRINEADEQHGMHEDLDFYRC